MSFLGKLFSRHKSKYLRIGILGSPNAGKTTLANRMSDECEGGSQNGVVSPVPHETREIVEMDSCSLSHTSGKLDLTIVDTPGIATQIDYREFMSHGLTKQESIERAKEATRGVIKAIQSLDKIDAAVVVVDSATQPFDQVNWTIIGNLQARNIPIVVAANKVDLPASDTELVKEVFQSDVVKLSALTGKGMDDLYNSIITLAY